MKTVIYTNSLEPITVIDLPDYVFKYLEERGTVRIPVWEPPRYIPADLTLNETVINYRQVTLTAHQVRGLTFSTGKNYFANHYILTTYDEESALLLKSTFLAGQTSALNEEKRRAFANGFMDALCRLGSV
jgi:hypothetical protein